MILKWRPLGICVAGSLAVCATAGMAPAQRQAGPPAVEHGAQPETSATRGIVLVRLVEGDERAAEKRPDKASKGGPDREKPDRVIVIDGEKIARDVEDAVGEAVSEAIDALEEMESSIRNELDGETLEALSEKYGGKLGEMREQLRDIGDRLAKDAAELGSRVTETGRKAVDAAREAGEALRETRVIVIRDGQDAKVEIEKDEEGRTVVVIEGEDVKVITGEPGQDEMTDQPPE